MDMITPFITYAIALAIAVVIPGPGIAALVGNALGASVRASIFFLLGMITGDIVLLTFAIAGLAVLAQTFADVFIIAKVLGALYLLHLAYKFWTREIGMTKVHSQKEQNVGVTFLTGLMVTLGNPKTILFYLALLPAVLDIESVDLSQWVTLCILTIIVVFMTLFPYIVLAAKARKMMTQPSTLKRLNRVASGTIGAAGAFILAEAVYSLLQRG